MGEVNVVLAGFNRGLVSKDALARIDLERVGLSGEIFNNCMPRILGSMMLRPGQQYLSTTRDNLYALHIPFIFDTEDVTDTAKLEFTDQTMRVKIEDDAIEREAVSTTVTSDDFSSATGWTDADEVGATSTISSGTLNLVGTKYNAAIRYQTVTVSGGDADKEHALRIVVTQGPVTLRVGSTVGGSEYVEAVLGTGVHSIAFTPSGNFTIQFSATRQYTAKVDSCEIEAAGAVEIPTPWVEADLRFMRADVSNNVLYIACSKEDSQDSGYQQRKIERRASGRSWSIVLYEPEDGPFLPPNTGNITIAASATVGDVTLTASRPLFTADHVGALFRMTSIGQRVDGSLSGDGQATNEIRIAGIGSSRSFNIDIAGTWTGTLTLQRSLGSPGSWTDITNYTGNTSTSYSDGLDNQIAYYRIIFKSGNYGSGTATITLRFASGGLTGVARITAFTNVTTVSAIVLKDLGGTGATELWDEGQWSDYRGYPSAVSLYEARLDWFGRGKFNGSISDSYESFDDESEEDAGDSAPISRSYGSGSVSRINWAVGGRRLLSGAPMAEWAAKSSNFDEVLTKDNVNLKTVSSYGSAPVPAVVVDNAAIFVDRSGTALMQTDYDLDKDDLATEELSKLVTEFFEQKIVRLAVQRRPDTRVHCVLEDGTVVIMVTDRLENVKCFVTYSTDGAVEDVFTLPGTLEDQVFYCVRRSINSQTVRYLERWAMETECRGETLNKQADSFIVYEGAATTVISVPHLAGKEVVAWGDGVDLSGDDDENPVTFSVDGDGNVNLPVAVENAVVGLPYVGRFMSTKLAYGIGQGETALVQKKKVHRLGLIMSYAHARGIRFGPRFDEENYPLDGMPTTEEGEAVDPNYIWPHYDKETFAFPGDWNTDSRICLEMRAPRPCRVLAVIISMVTNAKT